ncbi:MAG: hypothetical protein C0505_02860 [Leptothrix sp. (in: Bacteria)]|nr:hypothetical protein [Leptothrix sp. (in: b-proteobacteria)]
MLPATPQARPADSPRRRARWAGVAYLATLLLGIFAQAFVADRLIVGGSAAATAANILQHESLFRAGFAAYLIEMACQLTMIALFYTLLRPVDRTAAAIVVVLGLAGCVVKLMGRVFFYSPLLVLGGARYLSVFPNEQLQAVALLFLRINHTAETVAVVFFGLYTIVQGYLIFRSTFLPRALGVLNCLGGLGWLTYLYEPLARQLLSLVIATALFGAAATVFWLLVFGVDEQKWRSVAAEADRAPSSPSAEIRPA